jgi:hypothetical protein
VLFDEADNFLDADARDGFQVVTELRNLMNSSERRFKVVFAGLQNVQRFQGIPNQPLAHFGAALLIGPLEPDAAERLVLEPFQALGFRFPDSSVVLRILSYTNYHPGLIQLFCQELLRAMRGAVGAALPPYEIGPEVVERVYRQPAVRDSIRERFDWTLALDPRYQCIAWAMIVDQISDRDSYARAYLPGDALNLARGWWPDGFQDANFDRFRAVLDEMCGLGVLMRARDGRYRLRSPNLVRLMGRETDVENRLLELSQRQPRIAFDADSHRSSLDPAAKRYSPLTYAQARSVLSPRFGVVLVFGSPALGLDSLATGLQRGMQAGEPDEKLGDLTVLVPAALHGGEQLRSWLDRDLHSRKRQERLVAIQDIGGPVQSMMERVEAACRWCDERTRSRGRQWVRVVFVFGPQATRDWLRVPEKMLVDLESRVDAALTLGRWDVPGLRRRLEQHGMMSSEQRCERIVDATGGWPLLVDALFDRVGRRDDPLPASEQIRTELATPNSTMAQGFLASVGLDATPEARQVARFVREFREVGPDEMSAEVIEGAVHLDDRECSAAVEYLSRMGVLQKSKGKWVVDLLLDRILGVA